MNLIRKGLIRMTVMLLMMSMGACSVSSSSIWLEVTDLGTTMVTIEWNPIEDSMGYEVYVSSSLQEAYTLLGSTVESQYTDTTRDPSSSVTYKVRAYQLVDETMTYGPYSNPVETTTFGLAAPELVLGSYLSDQVLLAWLAVDGATGYQIRSYSTKTQSSMIICETNTLSCDIAIEKSKTYYLRIRAIFSSQTQQVVGSYSPVLIVNSKPINNPSIKLIPSSNGITVFWNEDPLIYGYEIYLSDDAVFVFSTKVQEVKTNQALLTGLDAGSSYTVWVRSYVKSGTDKTYSEFMPMGVTVTLPAQS